MSLNNEKLLDAIKNGEVKTVGKLLDAKLFSGEEMDAFEINHFKFDTLSKAVSEKNAEIVKLLLDRGFDLFYKTVEEVPVSLLHSCVRNFDAEIVEEFIKCGAFVNGVDRNQKTPIFEAIKKKDPDITKVLLNYGASVNAQSVNGTPLHEAIRSQNFEILELLIRSGADLDDLAGQFHRSPLQEAVDSNNAEIFKIILSYGALRPKGNSSLVKF